MIELKIIMMIALMGALLLGMRVSAASAHASDNFNLSPPSPAAAPVPQP